MKKKALLLVLAAALIVVASIGGTLAWLTAKPTAIENTFTVGEIGATLTEDTWNGTGADHVLVPNKTLIKDPVVTIAADSTDAYVFIKVTVSDDVDDVLDYSIKSDWTSYTSASGVYYQLYTSQDTEKDYPILADNQITVLDTADADALNKIGDTDIMKFAAAAVQADNLDYTAPATAVDAAYALVSSHLDS